VRYYAKASVKIDKNEGDALSLFSLHAIIKQGLRQIANPMDLRRLQCKILEDSILRELSALAKGQGTPLFVVGGYIRDLYLGTERRDYDLTLPRRAAFLIPRIEEMFHLRFFQVGKEATETATYRVVKGDMSLDITFLQGGTIDEDLERRDFSINAIAFSLQDETFSWTHNAWKDLEGRVIRTVSGRAIDLDPLRMLRAIRYLCTLEGFVLDSSLKEEIASKRGTIKSVPEERIKVELDRIFLAPRRTLGVKALFETGLLLTLFPELTGLQSLGQGEYHHLNVLPHTLLTIEKILWAIEWSRLREKNIPLSQDDILSLSYAALFHDLGKQETYHADEAGKVHFYQHESYSSQTAGEIMERLRFSNAMRERILRLVQNHMRIVNLSSQTKESALKRLVYQVGEDTPLLVLLTLADKEASRGILAIPKDEVVEHHCLRILELYTEKDVTHPPRLITGHDVMALGYDPGPKVGQILNVIRQRQSMGEIKSRQEALRILREKYAKKEG
jgi:tRNA nucleotidyltransferase/poly(A) polymerase